MSSLTIPAPSSRPVGTRSDGGGTGKKAETARVLSELQELCRGLKPGDMIPTRVELMRLFAASERAVRWALDELEREGEINRRQGAGTFISEPKHSGSTGTILPHRLTDAKTVVAITAPDHAIFERAMALLFRHVASADLSLACRLVDPVNPSLPIPKLEGSGWHDGTDALGYVVFGRALLPLAEQLHQAGNRTVLVGTPYVDVEPQVPTVQGDQEQGGYLAARHLLNLGHRRIAFRGASDLPHLRRWQGHQRALAEVRKRGLAVQDSVIYEDEYLRWQGAPGEAKAFFERPDAPTGIVVWNDYEAVPLLSLLSFIGVRVPEDVSVVGYDNLPEGERMHPPLTTVDGAIEQQLQAAVHLLTRPVAPSPSHTVVVLPTLVPRASSGPVKESLNIVEAVTAKDASRGRHPPL